jgi:hypothetical protein
MALLFAISMIGSMASVICYLSCRVALLSQLRRECPRLFEELRPHDSPAMWLGVIPDDRLLERLEFYGSTVATDSSVARYVKWMRGCFFAMLFFFVTGMFAIAAS